MSGSDDPTALAGGGVAGEYEDEYADDGEYADGGEYEYDDDNDELDDDGDELDMDFLANNPAMQRVQAALKRQLERQLTETNDELREKKAQLTDAKRRREDTGVSLYTAQQLLAKLQDKVERMKDSDDGLAEERSGIESGILDAKATLSDREKERLRAEKAAKSLRFEHSKLQKTLQQLDKLSTEMSSEIKLAQRAASKAAKEEETAEVRKQEQDLYVDRLQERLKALEDQRKVLGTQREAQAEQTQEALGRLNEAAAEVEAVRKERKEIATQWTAAEQGLTKRNEALSMMTAAADAQEQSILSKELEVVALKKQVAAAQGVHEVLGLQETRVDADIGAVARVVAATSKKVDRAKTEYSQKVGMLREEEAKLQKVGQAKMLEQSNVNAHRMRYERLHRELTELDADVNTKQYDQKTVDRFGQATLKGIRERQKQLTEMDLQLAQLENDSARVAVTTEGAETVVKNYKEQLKETEAALADRQADLQAFDSTTRANQLQAERNETKMSLLNRDIGVIIERRTAEGAGNADVTPQELERDRLTDTIAALVKENAERQQQWLQRQSELVRINKLMQHQQEETEMVNSKIAVLSQKKYRIAREIETNEKELKALQRNYAGLQRDVVKLDTLIASNQGVQEKLSNGNVLMETEFLRKLKDEELLSIQEQAEIEKTIDEKNRLLQEVLDAERAILQWEKKIQLAEEIREAIVDPDGEGEAAAMKREIHRMELRLVQLQRQREVLIQDMERAVERRGDINLAQKVASRSKDPNTRSAVEKQLRDLKSKIRQADRDARGVEADITALQGEADETERAIEEKRMAVAQMNDEMEDLSREYEVKKTRRDASSAEIIYFQQLYKHVTSLREKGRTVKKSREQLGKDAASAETTLQILGNVVEYLAENNPSVQPALAPIRSAIDTRITAPPSIDKL